MTQKQTKIELKGDAKKVGNGVMLTSGEHSDGELVIASPVTLSDDSWKCSYVVNISNSVGMSDVDGRGGDGVKMCFCSADGGQELFAVSLDTFKNLENESGNEVVVYFEGTKVAQAACRERFNDGEDKTVSIVYDNDLEVVSVKVNDCSVVAYAFNDFSFYELVQEPFIIRFTSFTGDAGGDHMVSNIGLIKI